jgi:hypothetical protein
MATSNGVRTTSEIPFNSILKMTPGAWMGNRTGLITTTHRVSSTDLDTARDGHDADVSVWKTRSAA